MWQSMHEASPYHMCVQDKYEDYATPVAESSGTQLANDGLVCSENQECCLLVDCLITGKLETSRISWHGCFDLARKLCYNDILNMLLNRACSSITLQRHVKWQVAKACELSGS